jgi:hypothetical protein
LKGFKFLTYHPLYPGPQLAGPVGGEVAQWPQFLHSRVHAVIIALALPGKVELSAVVI